MATNYKIASGITNGKSGGYDPYEAVRRIYDLKGDWNYANSNGNDAGKTTAASKAQNYYSQLRNNGYGEVADQLSDSDYGQSKSILDKYAKTNKTSTRQRLYDLGTKYGMTQEDINRLTTWDNDSGQVSFGGQLIGTPDSITSDGVSYWTDPSAIDNAFNAYIKTTGTTVPTGVNNAAYNQNVQAVNSTISELNGGLKSLMDSAIAKSNNLTNNTQATFDYANQDITGTDEYKSTWNSIMPAYNYKAGKAALNAAADASASNGGNIDSYAASNALRQQAALTAMGQQLAAEQGRKAYLDRITGMSTANNDMMNAQQTDYNTAQGFANAYDTSAARLQSLANDIFNNEQTSLNNASDRAQKDANADLIRAQVNDIWGSQTGQATQEALKKISPYYYNDGSVNTSIDYSDEMARFMSEINKIEAIPEGQRTEEQKQQLKDFKTQYGQAYIAREDKRRLDEYKNTEYISNPYSSAVNRVYGPYNQEDKQMDSAERLANMGYADEAANRVWQSGENAADRQNALDKINAQADANIREGHAAAEDTNSVNNNTSKNTINEYNAGVRSSLNDSSDTTSGSENNSSSNGKAVTDSDVKNWVSALNEYISKAWGDEYKLSSSGTPGKYTLPSSTKNVNARLFVVRQLLGSDLSAQQKDYMLHDVLGVPESEIQAYLDSGLFKGN